MKKRFGDFQNNKAYVCSTILDPNHKNAAFGSNPHKLVRIHDMVKEEVYKVVTKQAEAVAAVEEPEETDEGKKISPSVKSNKKAKFWKVYQKQKSQQTAKVSNVFLQRAKIDEELKRYMSTGAFEEEVDPIVWWIDEGSKTYPLLYDTAMKYLCIPATSVPSERVFSGAGNLLTKKRNRLSPRMANMMIVLHKNLQ